MGYFLAIRLLSRHTITFSPYHLYFLDIRLLFSTISLSISTIDLHFWSSELKLGTGLSGMACHSRTRVILWHFNLLTLVLFFLLSLQDYFQSPRQHPALCCWSRHFQAVPLQWRKLKTVCISKIRSSEFFVACLAFWWKNCSWNWHWETAAFWVWRDKKWTSCNWNNFITYFKVSEIFTQNL